MRFLATTIVLLGLLAAFCTATATGRLAVTDELVNAINSNPQSTWKASHNKFSTWTVEDVKRLMGTKITRRAPRTPVAVNPLVHAGDIPDTFDARDKWPTCIHPVRDQQKCGSCWAFSASEVLSDRFCIATGGKTDIIFSPEDLVECDNNTGAQGCDGATLPAAWQYIVSNGLASDTCIPYTSGDGNWGTCPSACADGSAIVRHKASEYHHVGFLIFYSESKIQQEIMNNGPVQAAFEVYQDFISYSSGVYKHQSGDLLGGHAIEIIGWGVESNQKYWLVKNSWGTSWGLQGFFKILRGTNECGIEQEVYTGTPAQ